MTAAILSAFAPVLAMILTGYVVRATGWLPAPVWFGVNALNYRLLLPCLLFAVLAQADFSAPGLIRLAVASATASLAMAMIALLAAKLFRLDRGATAPLLAVAGLWNLVMFMALGARLLGPDLYAASAAILGPGTIVGAAIAVAAFALTRSGSTGIGVKRLALDPLVLGTLAGLAFNIAGLTAIPLLTETVALMGAGATAAILISMGAGLEFRALRGRVAPLSLAALLRAVAAPAVFLTIGLTLGLPAEHVVLITLAGGAPGAAVTYAIATEFNGERTLTAGMLTASVLASALALPVFTALAIAATGLGV